MPYQQITINVNDAVAERLADALMGTRRIVRRH